MDQWTTEKVGQWLKENGFDDFVEKFQREDIDGLALIGLNQDEIEKLLTFVDSSGVIHHPTHRILRRFRNLIHGPDEKQQENSPRSLRRSLNSSISSKNLAEYSKTFFIESKNEAFKFFENYFILEFLRKYFFKTYQVTMEMSMVHSTNQTLKFSSKLIGKKENVKNVLQEIETIFEKVRMKIFNEENMDKKMIQFSREIHSDSALIVLQRIFLEKKKITLWKKTRIVSGYFCVFYLDGQHKFCLNEDFLCRIINEEILFVKENIKMNVQQSTSCFQNEFQQFRRQYEIQSDKSSTITLIHSPILNQNQLQITFFGLRTIVQMAKIQLKRLIKKHQRKKTQIRFDQTQCQFLLTNHRKEIKEFELKFKDDQILILLEEKYFLSPEYLIEKVHEFLRSMLDEEKQKTYQFLENLFDFNEIDRRHLENIVQCENCQLREISFETKNELLKIPKVENEINSTSKYFSNQSNEFLRSIFRRKTIFIGENQIEIREKSHSKVDLKIISNRDELIQSQLSSTEENGFFESENGNRILFFHWIPTKSIEELKRSMGKFLYSIFELIQLNYQQTIRTIELSTDGWQNFGEQKTFIQFLIESFEEQLKKEKFSQQNWKISLIFHRNQIEFFDEFLKIFSKISNENQLVEEFYFPVTTMKISIDGTKTKFCERFLENYLKTRFFTTVNIEKAFQSKFWNQSMINSFFKLSFDEKVLPIYDETQKSLRLIGPKISLENLQEKYQTFQEIEKLKEIPEEIRVQPLSKQENRTNLLLVGLSSDEKIFEKFLQRFQDENFLISIYYFDKNSTSNVSIIDRTDLILIIFTMNFSSNSNLNQYIEMIQLSKKSFLPIFQISKTEKNLWRKSFQLEKYFYQTFRQDIRWKFFDEFQKNFYQLLIEVLKFTKPGRVGQIYSSIEVTEINENQEIEVYFGSKRKISFTEQEIELKEKSYSIYVEKTIEKQQIPHDDVDRLVRQLKSILTFSESENEDDRSSIESSSNDDKRSMISRTLNPIYIDDFYSLIQRWIDKASKSKMIPGNFHPFTLSGDYNDAIFPINHQNKDPWWSFQFESNDENSSTTINLNEKQTFLGSWSNDYESHQLFSRQIDKDIQFRPIDEDVQSCDEPENRRMVNFNLSIDEFLDEKKDRQQLRPAAWDLMKNRMFILEYRQRKSNNNQTMMKPNQFENWNRIYGRDFQLFSEIKENKLIHRRLELVQRRIGNERKTESEMKKLEQLDDPNNQRWKKKIHNEYRRKFLQEKLKNIRELEKLCQINQK